MAFRKKLPFNLWIALTLSTLFFYPLIATLYDNHIILQWRKVNTFELIAAIILLTCIFFIFLWLIQHKIKDQKIRVFFILLLFIIPFVSFFVHFLSQLGLRGSLISLGELSYQYRIITVLICTVAVFLVVFLIWRYTGRMEYILIIVLITLSSINLLAGWTLFSHRNVDTKIAISKSVNNPLKHNNNPKTNFIIFLFDELSYEYLFKDNRVDGRYKGFQELSEISDVYHNAFSPGSQTLTAIPGLLMKKRYDDLVIKYDWIYRITKQQKIDYLTVEQTNLFSIALEKGLKAFAVGNYIPYCEMFGKYLDECRCYSEYNFASVNNGFSIINPILTTFVIWPRQKPQGLIKNIASSLLQRHRIELTHNFIEKKIKDTKEAFFFICPHIYPPSPICV